MVNVDKRLLNPLLFSTDAFTYISATFFKVQRKGQ